MLIQAAVGLLGFYYHTAAIFSGPSPSRVDNFVYGDPALAPLLFPNLALLVFIALVALRWHLATADGVGAFNARSDAVAQL